MKTEVVSVNRVSDERFKFISKYLVCIFQSPRERVNDSLHFSAASAPNETHENRKESTHFSVWFWQPKEITEIARIHQVLQIESPVTWQRRSFKLIALFREAPNLDWSGCRRRRICTFYFLV